MIGGESLLALFSFSLHLVSGLSVFQWIAFVLFVEPCVAVFHDGVVEVSAAQVALTGELEDLGVLIGESNDRQSGLGGADVDEEHVLQVFGQLALAEEALLEGERRVFGGESEQVHARDLGGVAQHLLLRLVELDRVREAELEGVHRQLAVAGELGEQHAQQLFDAEPLRLVLDVQFDFGHSVVESERHVLPVAFGFPLLLGDADQAYQVLGRVFEQLAFQSGRGVSQEAFLASEIDHWLRRTQ